MTDGLTELSLKSNVVFGMEMSISRTIQNADYGSLNIELSLSFEARDETDNNVKDEVYERASELENDFQENKGDILVTCGAVAIAITSLASIVLTGGASTPLAVECTAFAILLLAGQNNPGSESNSDKNDYL